MAVPILKQNDSRTPLRQRRYWKVTLRSGPLLEFVLLGKCYEEFRVFRWKWLALAVAHRHHRRVASGCVTTAHVEPYVPGTNVIPMFTVMDTTAHTA
jgi:hypothetical protein